MNDSVRPVIILGCGESINSLSADEKARINSSDAVVGLNKFMVFADAAGIWPSHAFFADFWSFACDSYIQLMFDFCRREGLRDVTFVLNRKFGMLRRARVGRATVLVDRALTGSPVVSKQRLISLKRRVVGSGSVAVAARELKDALANEARARLGQTDQAVTEVPVVNPRLSSFVLPPGCNYEYVRCESSEWATSLDQDLFHHRGSLTSAINYCAIRWPGRDMLLVGTDFYSSDYFFEKTETYRRARVLDYTGAVAKESGRHFSTVEQDSTTIFDSFPFINEKLAETGAGLYCANERSLLVKHGCVTFRSIDSF